MQVVLHFWLFSDASQCLHYRTSSWNSVGFVLSSTWWRPHYKYSWCDLARLSPHLCNTPSTPRPVVLTPGSPLGSYIIHIDQLKSLEKIWCNRLQTRMFTVPHKKRGLTPPAGSSDSVLVVLMLLRVGSNLLLLWGATNLLVCSRLHQNFFRVFCAYFVLTHAHSRRLPYRSPIPKLLWAKHA
jgi:hypothetical protein